MVTFVRENIKTIINEIKNNEKTEVSVKGKLLKDELKELSAAIKENHAIKTITFSNVYFYMYDMFKEEVLQQEMLPVYIAGFLLKGNCSLEIINLPENSIKDDGVLYMVQALKNNSTLKHLNLANNMVSNKGAKSIAVLLSIKKSSIESIDLSGNNIGSEGIEYIYQGIQSSASLKLVNLSNNPDGITNKMIISNTDNENSLMNFTSSVLKPDQLEEVKPQEQSGSLLQQKYQDTEKYTDLVKYINDFKTNLSDIELTGENNGSDVNQPS